MIGNYEGNDEKESELGRRKERVTKEKASIKRSKEGKKGRCNERKIRRKV